ncbi:hypothetical protein AMTR_s02387p00009250, partial [Amborella trichopoda]
LKEVSGLAQRMAALMCVNDELSSINGETYSDSEDHIEVQPKESVMDSIDREVERTKNHGSDVVQWLELEELDIDDAIIQSLDLS